MATRNINAHDLFTIVDLLQVNGKDEVANSIIDQGIGAVDLHGNTWRMIDRLMEAAHAAVVGTDIEASEEPEEGNMVTIIDGIRTEGPAIESIATCLCGCGQEVKNEFKPGHDQRYKVSLMRSVLEGDELARGILERRGWMKFFPAFAANEVKRRERAQLARCAVCGQPLTDPESVARGIGPVCQHRVSEKAA